jgi:hypothetical protein
MFSLGSQDRRLTDCYTASGLESSKPNMTLLTGMYADMKGVYARCSLNDLQKSDGRWLNVDQDHPP